MSSVFIILERNILTFGKLVIYLVVCVAVIIIVILFKRLSQESSINFLLQ